MDYYKKYIKYKSKYIALNNSIGGVGSEFLITEDLSKSLDIFMRYIYMNVCNMINNNDISEFKPIIYTNTDEPTNIYLIDMKDTTRKSEKYKIALTELHNIIKTNNKGTLIEQFKNIVTHKKNDNVYFTNSIANIIKAILEDNEEHATNWDWRISDIENIFSTYIQIDENKSLIQCDKKGNIREINNYLNIEYINIKFIQTNTFSPKKTFNAEYETINPNK